MLNLNAIAHDIALWKLRVDHIRETHHTCPDGANKLYVFPPVQGCGACEAYVGSRVKANHWELPRLLFGFEAIVEMIYHENMQKIKQREARLHRGAYI